MTRYAETILDVGRYPLRRRDRAAMVLALECLRWYPRGPEASDALRDASDALRLPMWEVGPRTAIGAELYEAVRQTWQDDRSCRLLRARLALLLRVLLRVDAGDYGGSRPAECHACGGAITVFGDGAPCDVCGGLGDLRTSHIRPLWEAAR